MLDYGQRYPASSKRRKTQNKPIKLWWGAALGVAVAMVTVFIWVKTLSGGQKPLNPQSKTPGVLPKNLPPTTMLNTQLPLSSQIETVTQGKQGQYGWYVQSLTTGETYGNNTDFSYTAASINKVPIMVSFLKEVEVGNFDLGDNYQLDSADLEAGSGFIQYQPLGTEYTLRELVVAAGKNSDNTAVNALWRLMGTDKVDLYLKKWNMPNTSVVANKTTLAEMVELFSLIYRDKIFSRLSTKELFYEALTKTDYEDRISQGVPSDVVVVHKIGNQIQVWSDCGLVLGSSPYAVCILTDGIKESEAQEVVPKISKLIWEHESLKNP